MTCAVVTSMFSMIEAIRELQVRVETLIPTIELPEDMTTACGDSGGQGLLPDLYFAVLSFVLEAGEDVTETVARPPEPTACGYRGPYLYDVEAWIDGIILVGGCTATNVYDPDNGWTDVLVNGTPSSGNGSITGRFIFDDSANCGGSNSLVQSGRCEFHIVLSAETTVGYRVCGNVETENAGYDQAAASRDGFAKASIVSTSNGGGCTMEPKDSTLIEETLQAGTYLFAIATSTVDGLYHSDMVHNFEILFGEGDI